MTRMGLVAITACLFVGLAFEADRLKPTERQTEFQEPSSRDRVEPNRDMRTTRMPQIDPAESEDILELKERLKEVELMIGYEERGEPMPPELKSKYESDLYWEIFEDVIYENGPDNAPPMDTAVEVGTLEFLIAMKKSLHKEIALRQIEARWHAP